MYRIQTSLQSNTSIPNLTPTQPPFLPQESSFFSESQKHPIVKPTTNCFESAKSKQMKEVYPAINYFADQEMQTKMSNKTSTVSEQTKESTLCSQATMISQLSLLCII
jgi:hypothetical protein